MAHIDKKPNFILKHGIIIGFALLSIGIALPIITYFLFQHLILVDSEKYGGVNQSLMLEAFLAEILSFGIGLFAAIGGLVLLIFVGIRSLRRM